MKNKKSFWGGVLSGVLGVALVACGIYLGSSLWNFLGLYGAQETAVPESADEGSVATQETLNKIGVLEETIDNGQYRYPKLKFERRS